MKNMCCCIHTIEHMHVLQIHNVMLLHMLLHLCAKHMLAKPSFPAQTLRKQIRFMKKDMSCFIHIIEQMHVLQMHNVMLLHVLLHVCAKPMLAKPSFPAQTTRKQI